MRTRIVHSTTSNPILNVDGTPFDGWIEFRTATKWPNTGGSAGSRGPRPQGTGTKVEVVEGVFSTELRVHDTDNIIEERFRWKLSDGQKGEFNLAHGDGTAVNIVDLWPLPEAPPAGISPIYPGDNVSELVNDVPYVTPVGILDNGSLIIGNGNASLSTAPNGSADQVWTMLSGTTQGWATVDLSDYHQKIEFSAAPTTDEPLKADGSGGINFGGGIGFNGIGDSLRQLNDSLFIGENVMPNDPAFSVGIGKNTAPTATGGSAYNVAIGRSALASVTSGSHNLGLGFNTGLTLSTGWGNVLIGSAADTNIFDAYGRIAIGYNAIATKNSQMMIGGTDGGASATNFISEVAMYARDSSSWQSLTNTSTDHGIENGRLTFDWFDNTHASRVGRFVARINHSTGEQPFMLVHSGGAVLGVGTYAANSSEDQRSLSAFGHYAGQNVTGADNLTALGYYAGQASTGANNTFVGTYAGRNGDGGNATAVGMFASDNATTVVNSTVVGVQANQNGTKSTAHMFGYQAGLNNTGDLVSAFGYRSANNNTGIIVTAFGYRSADGNEGASITAIGHQALVNNTSAGTNATAVGLSALQSNSGANVTAVGHQAGYENTAGNLSAVGVGAAYQNTGEYVMAFGRSAASLNSGNYVTAMGYQSLENNSGANVTAFGARAARNNTVANGVFIGFDSGVSNSGVNSTGIGYRSLHTNTGVSVTAIGYSAGDGNTGTNSTFIGREAGSGNTFNRVMCIGMSAVADMDDQAVIGSGDAGATELKITGTSQGQAYRALTRTSTLDIVDNGSIKFDWQDNTHASRVGQVTISANDWNGSNRMLTLRADQEYQFGGSSNNANRLRMFARSSTTNNMAVGEIRTQWVNAVHANRTSETIFYNSDYNGSKQYMRAQAVGIEARLSFFGATPVGQQPGGAQTAGASYGATEQDMLQKVYDAVRNLGLMA